MAKEAGPDGVFSKSHLIADDYHRTPSSGQSDVDSSLVGYEADLARLIRPNSREDGYVLLAALHELLILMLGQGRLPNERLQGSLQVSEASKHWQKAALCLAVKKLKFQVWDGQLTGCYQQRYTEFQ